MYMSMCVHVCVCVCVCVLYGEAENQKSKAPTYFASKGVGGRQSSVPKSLKRREEIVLSWEAKLFIKMMDSKQNIYCQKKISVRKYEIACFSLWWPITTATTTTTTKEWI